ncbi:MAG: hypothetical protein ACT4P4_18420, partial [Betaproteobacteria bacterium]
TATFSFGASGGAGVTTGAGCRSEGEDVGAGARDGGACVAQPAMNINLDVAPAKAEAHFSNIPSAQKSGRTNS